MPIYSNVIHQPLNNGLLKRPDSVDYQIQTGAEVMGHTRRMTLISAIFACRGIPLKYWILEVLCR